MNNTEHWISKLHLGSHVPLDKKSIDFIGERLVMCKYGKGEVIVKPGEVCDRVNFIRSGIVKGYYTFEKREVVSWISYENQVFTTSSFFENSKAKEFVKALENTTVDYLTYNDVKEGCLRFKPFRDLKEKLLEQYYAHAEERAFIARIPLAKNRMKYLEKYFGDVDINRIPNRDIASFLGISPEAFSQLKSKLKR